MEPALPATLDIVFSKGPAKSVGKAKTLFVRVSTQEVFALPATLAITTIKQPPAADL